MSERQSDEKQLWIFYRAETSLGNCRTSKILDISHHSRLLRINGNRQVHSFFSLDVGIHRKYFYWKISENLVSRLKDSFFAHHVELKTSGKDHSREFDVSCVCVWEWIEWKTGGKTFEYGVCVCVCALESIEFNENLIGFHKFTARPFPSRLPPLTVHYFQYKLTRHARTTLIVHWDFWSLQQQTINKLALG